MRVLLRVLSGFLVFLLALGTVDALEISACGTLSNASTTYHLSGNVSSNGTCFQISADDIILDCSGHTITYSMTSLGYGVTASGRSNITVRNCTILKGAADIDYAYAVYLSSTTGSNISSNTINVGSAKYAYGVNLVSSTGNTIEGKNANFDAGQSSEAFPGAAKTLFPGHTQTRRFPVHSGKACSVSRPRRGVGFHRPAFNPRLQNPLEHDSHIRTG